MKSIKVELARNNLILVFCALVFLGCNLFVYLIVTWQNNNLLEDYQKINDLVIINDERKTNFKVYCKSHDSELLEEYNASCEQLNLQLAELKEQMQHDNNCKMMYRLVCQVVQHSQETAKEYMNPTEAYDSGLVTYLDEVDLELDSCINQLINHYLDYMNAISVLRSDRLKVVVTIVNLLMILGCFVLIQKNYKMHAQVLESVEKLTEAATEITNKNFEADDIKEVELLELNQVSNTFDQMKHTIRNMLIELEEKHQMKEHLAEAKIRELQMQMNPHFLFNSLSLVVRNIQLDEKDTAVQLINSISKILRSSIEIKELAIPLDDEIDLLQAYLYIQKLHMRGRVSFYLDVRKSFVEQEFKIPPLTIQPLVENCVKHGLKDVISDGRVEILITEKADYMEVVVADNGVGFTNLTEINTEVKKKVNGISKTSIGFSNVRERLKLYYQKDDVMKVERIDGITKITLKLYKTGRC